MPLERLYILIQHLTKHFHSLRWVCVTVYVSAQMWHDVSAYSIVSHSPFLPQLSLSPSSVLKSLPLSPSPLLRVLYFSPSLSSCCFIWLPDLSSLISVHPLHFDVSPHTATLTTTKTMPLLTLYLSPALCLSYNLFCLALYISLFCLFTLLLFMHVFHMFCYSSSYVWRRSEDCS